MAAHCALAVMLAANSMNEFSPLAQLHHDVDMVFLLKYVFQRGYIEGASQPPHDLYLLPDGIQMPSPFRG